jgi:hypothetical protein
MARAYDSVWFTAGPLFMDKLKEVNMIAKNMFAFYLTNNPD